MALEIGYEARSVLKCDGCGAMVVYLGRDDQPVVAVRRALDLARGAGWKVGIVEHYCPRCEPPVREGVGSTLNCERLFGGRKARNGTDSPGGHRHVRGHRNLAGGSAGAVE